VGLWRRDFDIARLKGAQVDAEFAQRRFMMVDPGNRLVADTLEGIGTKAPRIGEGARRKRTHTTQASDRDRRPYSRAARDHDDGLRPGVVKPGDAESRA
jgi:hypothetical protein